MRERTAKNDIQAELFEWGHWVRTRKYVVREFLPPAFVTVLAQFMPRSRTVDRDTRLNPDSSLIWGLWRGMGNESQQSQARAAALWLHYVIELKEESSALELGLSRTGFQRLRNSAEADIQRRRLIFLSTERMRKEAEELECMAD